MGSSIVLDQCIFSLWISSKATGKCPLHQSITLKLIRSSPFYPGQGCGESGSCPRNTWIFIIDEMPVYWRAQCTDRHSLAACFWKMGGNWRTQEETWKKMWSSIQTVTLTRDQTRDSKAVRQQRYLLNYITLCNWPVCFGRTVLCHLGFMVSHDLLKISCSTCYNHSAHITDVLLSLEDWVEHFMYLQKVFGTFREVGLTANRKNSVSGIRGWKKREWPSCEKETLKWLVSLQDKKIYVCF